ncbi:MAG TPA: hypothetical protein VE778_00130 [Candidatus Bathyarchaeia archaeon]|jgi:hypothetical protein|nr:hypothetical protein [Candidatus Bathyarchaeia archaeon]
MAPSQQGNGTTGEKKQFSASHAETKRGTWPEQDHSRIESERPITGAECRENISAPSQRGDVSLDIPFYRTAEERAHAGVQHRPFFAQVEFCDNLIFRRRAAVDALEQRLLDANRTIGQPNKLTLIFGRRITRHHAGKLQTVIEDLNLPNPVIRSHYRKGFLKQYVRDRFLLRTETATNNTSTDYAIGKAVDNLPQLRQRLDGIIDRYLDVQQDILETFVDREQLRQLTQPTLLPNGRRIPGLKLDQPRQLALMHSLVRFCYLAAEGTFATRDLYPQTLQTLKMTPEEYKLGSLRYDLWKLRAKAWSKRSHTPAATGSSHTAIRSA